MATCQLQHCCNSPFSLSATTHINNPSPCLWFPTTTSPSPRKILDFPRITLPFSRAWKDLCVFPSHVMIFKRYKLNFNCCQKKIIIGSIAKGQHFLSCFSICLKPTTIFLRSWEDLDMIWHAFQSQLKIFHPICIQKTQISSNLRRKTFKPIVGCIKIWQNSVFFCFRRTTTFLRSGHVFTSFSGYHMDIVFQ